MHKHAGDVLHVPASVITPHRKCTDGVHTPGNTNKGRKEIGCLKFNM